MNSRSEDGLSCDGAMSGMMDEIDTGGAGPTPGEIEFVQAYVASGPMDAAMLARLVDPERMAVRRAKEEKRLRTDWSALNQYRDANAALRDRSTNVVFIGDSLTEFWQVAHPDLFVDGTVNRGISGQTSPQILLRFMADVVALEPKAAHLLCGGNDIAGNTGPTTPQDYKNNILAMLDIAAARGIKMVIGSLTPFRQAPWNPKFGDARPRIAELNAWLADVAAARGLMFADYHAALAGADGAMIEDYTRDGVHPTRAGYDVMRPIAEAALSRALAH
ncbi:GDSL-type esterase/lipase family protein [Brevundimonas sp.]|uniref:GDSL-type esterase/lipase family protein n=1 Tax=Brevundimonas sp. TaxID=1871086 RepID=UPI0028A2D0D8|nr:GDSL-type esterase/lipase family protein [Brevundimonas sp.]